MKRLFIIIFLCSASSLAAQNSPLDLLGNFFKTYETEPGRAVADIYSTNKWMSRIQDEVNNVVKTVESFTEDYMGVYHGYELITTAKLGESFVLYSYMMKYDRQPIRYMFKFYKPENKWLLYSFELDDKLGEELEEAAKLHNLNHK